MYCSADTCDTPDTNTSTPALSINSVAGVVFPAAAYLVCVVATGLHNLANDLLRLLLPVSRVSFGLLVVSYSLE